MRLEDMLKDISGITNKVVKTNCFEGQNTLLDSILLIQTKVNEVIQAINNGIIKGDKGDKGDTGDKGDKGDKGDTGKATESIQDGVTSLDTTWSSTKIDSYFNDIKNIQGVKYGNDVGYQVCKGTHNGVVKDLKIYGKSLVNLNQSKINAYCDIAIEPKKITHNITTISYVANTVVGKEYTIVKYPSNRFVIGFAPNSEYMTNLTSFIQPTLNTSKTEVVKVVATDVKMIVYVTNESKDTNVVILDGDHTQNPPQYFEGIASVGNGNEIEVLSSNMPYDYSVELVSNIRKNFNLKKDIVAGDVIKNISDKSVIALIFDSTTLSWVRDATLNKGDTYIVPNGNVVKTITIYPHNGWNISSEIFLESLISVNNYLKQDKKTILFKDVDNTWKPILNLRGVDENNCDIVDSVSNKFIKKYGVRSYQVGDETNSNVITDMTNTVYKLDEQLEYEINPIYPESYSNETMISFNTGVINCKNEFYIDSNLGSLQLETNERLSRIEDYIYQSNVAILRGDFRSLAELYYPNDFIKKEELPNE